MCYLCGEKFDQDHLANCPKRAKPQLHALTATDFDMPLTEDVLDQLSKEDELAQALCQLSINAIAGTEEGDAFKIRAIVNKKVMLQLIDSGSSHSFVSKQFLDSAGVQSCSSKPYQVQVANGAQLVCNQVVPFMEWWAQGHTFQHEMKVLELWAYDAILGMDWLKPRSPMLCDWDKKTIQFEERNKQVLLKGVHTSQASVQQISGDQLYEWAGGNDIWALAVLSPIIPENNNSVPDEVKQLLGDFADVFQEPTDLPPSRSYDHCIPLLPNATPVNSRPYRYSPQHKDEI